MPKSCPRLGYATAFHGKWHLGDIEESYAHNQGFDEAFFTGYNQILSLWTRKGEAANATIGLYEDMLPEDPYKLDDTFITKGWVLASGRQKGRAGETMGRQQPRHLHEDGCRSAKANPGIHRAQRQGGQAFLRCQLAQICHRSCLVLRRFRRGEVLLQDGLQGNVDPFVGKVMAKLRELGIAENTLLICNADNGPMAHNPPPGCGFTETIFPWRQG